jgi:hypothetical protein
MPSTPFIGVRISWLIVARNVDFASLAASASARGFGRVGALAQLGDQPRVLDRQYRLARQCLHQPHCLGPELAGGAPLQDQCAEDALLADQWHDQRSAEARREAQVA